jgi:anthranilate phosphoribosyltransferase
VNTFYLHPSDVGLPKAAPDALRGGSATDNAQIIMRVLEGEHGPARDVVLLNAGAALFIAGAATSVQEGMDRAGRAIDTMEARSTLNRLCAVSGAEEPAAGARA